MLEDLKQEGALALIDAAKRYDAGHDAQLLTYASKAIQTAMADCIAGGALPVCIPSERFWQLRRVSEAVVDGMVSAGEEPVLQKICGDLGVSKKVARDLLAEYRTLFHFEELSENTLPMAWGGDPAREYDHRMRKELAVKLLDEVLKPRERNVVVYHLGIGQSRAMTFEELAARLNYNDPSAAEKAYRRAVRKLREHKDEGELGTWIWAARAIRETMQATVDYFAALVYAMAKGEASLALANLAAERTEDIEMRLFIAIQLSDEIRDGLSSVQTYLIDHGVRGNYTKTENLHLTLAFIGEYSDSDFVLEVLRSVPFAPFPLRIEGFGSFGDLYWCGVGESDSLRAYVKRLRRALAENGIPFDRKKFSPHITLIRRAEFDRRRGFPGVTIPELSMQVSGASLMRSDRTKSGMVYTEIGP